MYGNNFNPYIMSNMSYGPMMRGTMIPMANPTRGLGGIRTLLGLSSNGMARGINWSSILNNTSKTLGVIKEAIPVVKEVQPMLHNMRSIVKIASAFKDETDATPNKNIDNNQNNSNNNINNTGNNNIVNNDNKTYNNEPNFFI